MRLMHITKLAVFWRKPDLSSWINPVVFSMPRSWYDGIKMRFPY